MGIDVVEAAGPTVDESWGASAASGGVDGVRAVEADELDAIAGDSEAGMATAEYAIATLAAAGFAGLLVVILRSNEVREFLLAIIRQALSI